MMTAPRYEVARIQVRTFSKSVWSCYTYHKHDVVSHTLTQQDFIPYILRHMQVTKHVQLFLRVTFHKFGEYGYNKVTTKIFRVSEARMCHSQQ